MPPPGWTKPDKMVETVFTPTSRELGDSTWTFNVNIGELWALLNQNADLGAMHGIGAPIHVYPLYENAFRAHRKQSLEQNNNESAALYAEFAKVAERQPYSWNYKKPVATADFIGTVSKLNRMICFPCNTHFARLPGTC